MAVVSIEIPDEMIVISDTTPIMSLLKARLLELLQKNDMEYDFKPLEFFAADPDYKVDEKGLEKSIEK